MLGDGLLVYNELKFRSTSSEKDWPQTISFFSFPCTHFPTIFSSKKYWLLLTTQNMSMQQFKSMCQLRGFMIFMMHVNLHVNIIFIFRIQISSRLIPRGGWWAVLKPHNSTSWLMEAKETCLSDTAVVRKGAKLCG